MLYVDTRLWLPDLLLMRGDKIGIIDSEELLSQFAEVLRKRLHPRDVAGRFEGTSIMVLLERGSPRDGQVWGADQRLIGLVDPGNAEHRSDAVRDLRQEANSGGRCRDGAHPLPETVAPAMRHARCVCA